MAKYLGGIEDKDIEIIGISQHFFHRALMYNTIITSLICWRFKRRISLNPL